ncbi:signal peptidase I [Candidatus Roizmanbacteria bacterium RIFCSPHIGHO2_01_FULL_39_12b]|uniref:Signal peptidase I n=1 Tax=Candidatus Roizmanbacteria bacterium RIFCSPHIGHO2_01_FULL_39_12b TaxID=1802030 RepID=A0A1F7GDE1_9BACT|nr:MAG: signal peptidase I [Candidatus Roizmanbacteria bacterium RIFCSPHIGHO2_01_FULL_39_12b]OGK46660.1 MAG: signal peptidase I [Candidatus Roizmanbacteria bacterium RIFCSPLOWO2_01_FULL_39_19]
MDILETITFVGSLFIVVYLFVAQPHQIKGISMDDTFHNGDYILTSKISYKFETPHLGDIVVFQSPSNPDIDYIKRIIGVSGDRILIKDGSVIKNGVTLEEPYAKRPINVFEGGFLQQGQEVIVPERYVFVMGDNRPRSSDSREFGFVPLEHIVGKVFFRYFPPQQTGLIENPYTRNENPLQGLNFNSLAHL